MARKQNNVKSDNKTVIEKAPKALSPKQQIELDHILGKHTLGQSSMDIDLARGMASNNPSCGFCSRRIVHITKKLSSMKRFYAGNKK